MPSVGLSPQVMRRIRALAEREGKSIDEVIKESLAAFESVQAKMTTADDVIKKLGLEDIAVPGGSRRARKRGGPVARKKAKKA